MELFLFVFLLTFSKGFSAVTMNTRVHIHVNINKNWQEAQSYCREKYKDLSTITDSKEHLSLSEVAWSNYPNSWIGLYRSSTDKTRFIWSDGGLQTTFTTWKHNQPGDINSNQDCVETINDGWADYGCFNKLPFFCFKSTIMESDRKTWEEALGYCRDHYTDLSSLTSKEIQQVENKIVSEEFVWVGLHFLAGNWYWLNLEPVKNKADLSECPIFPYRCGGRNLTNNKWEQRDCEEKHSFLCDWI